VSAIRALAAGAGVLADAIAGEPPAAVHPVAAFGRLMIALEDVTYRDDRGAGVIHLAVGAAVALTAGAALRRLIGPTAATFVATELAVSGCMLARTARALAAQLDRGDVEAARRLLPSLVGRDPSALDPAEIARAVVESVAENTVDAVVAPALWAAVTGAPGVLVHRAVNTLDSMVGHRSARYARFGWGSARIDDAMAWVPARLTAIAVAAVRPRATRSVWRAVRRDAPAHPSPNAGVAEAAFAAALGLRLGGTNRYGERVEHRAVVGTGRRPEPGDIEAAVRLARDVRWAVAASLVVAGGAATVAGRRGHRR
jgi:adenosylcobinamide-phosphate synthase